MTSKNNEKHTHTKQPPVINNKGHVSPVTHMLVRMNNVETDDEHAGYIIRPWFTDLSGIEQTLIDMYSGYAAAKAAQLYYIGRSKRKYEAVDVLGECVVLRIRAVVGLKDSGYRVYATKDPEIDSIESFDAINAFGSYAEALTLKDELDRKWRAANPLPEQLQKKSVIIKHLYTEDSYEEAMLREDDDDVTTPDEEVKTAPIETIKHFVDGVGIVEETVPAEPALNYLGNPHTGSTPVEQVKNQQYVVVRLQIAEYIGDTNYRIYPVRDPSLDVKVHTLLGNHSSLSGAETQLNGLITEYIEAKLRSIGEVSHGYSGETKTHATINVHVDVPQPIYKHVNAFIYWSVSHSNTLYAEVGYYIEGHDALIIPIDAIDDDIANATKSDHSYNSVFQSFTGDLRDDRKIATLTMECDGSDEEVNKVLVTIHTVLNTLEHTIAGIYRHREALQSLAYSLPNKLGKQTNI